MKDPASVATPLIPHLEARGFAAEYVATGKEAAEAVFRYVPEGATVMAGASVTLDTIGVTDRLTKGNYDYLRAKIRATSDPAERQKLRARSFTASWFLGSVAAITEDGVLVAADNGGSRVAGYAFGPERVLLVASVHKVVPDLDAAFERVRSVAAPKEQERVDKGPVHYASNPNKWLILEGEAHRDRIIVILVGEQLGF